MCLTAQTTHRRTSCRNSALCQVYNSQMMKYLIYKDSWQYARSFAGRRPLVEKLRKMGFTDWLIVSVVCDLEYHGESVVDEGKCIIRTDLKDRARLLENAELTVARNGASELLEEWIRAKL